MAVRRESLRWAVNCSLWKPTASEWIRAMSCVQEEEKDRINQFVFVEDATQALVGRLLLRAAIVSQLGVSNAGINIGRMAAGKPYMVTKSDENRLEFNVSHQGDYTVLATAWNNMIGVDVMQLTRPRGTTVPKFFHTMRRQFTDWEWQQIRSISPDETSQLRLFYRLWCLKESYIKCEGSGLSHGLQRLEFTLSPVSTWTPGAVTVASTLSVDGQLADGWVFEESFIDDQHCVAVAFNRSQSTVEQHSPQTFQHIRPDHLQSLLNPLHAGRDSDWDLHSTKQHKSTQITQ